MIDTSKVIHAPVGGGRYTVTAPIVKEDYGLYLKIEGLELPSTYEVDFSNSEHNGTSVAMIGNADGVLIPHQFIDTGKDVFAFLYHVGVDFGRTVYKFRIPNKLRPDRTDEEPTPEEQSVIDQCISALNTAVAKTAQDVISADQSARSASDDADRAERARTGAETAQGKAEEAQESAERAKDDAETSERNASESERKAKGYAETASEKADAITGLTATATTLPDGSQASASYNAETGVMSFGIPKGKDGTDGDDGYSPTANVSKSGKVVTITITDKNGTTSAQVSDGTDGTDGEDGVSPSVSVTDITGGHRVVITDKDGTESFDVEDGATGATPNLTIGTVETLEPTESATATITGTPENPVLNLGIPQGEQGEITTEELLKAFPTDTASGAIASFSDGADDLPLKSLIVDINPIQDLSNGDPSPENICPISGHTQAVATRTGVNVWDEEWEVGGISSADGSKYNDNNRIRSKNFIPVKPSTKYYFAMPSTLNAFKVAFYGLAKDFLSFSIYKNNVITTPSNCYWLMLSENGTDYGVTYNHDISINYPSTDHDYHAYTGRSIAINLGQTVYGGHLDVISGVLTVDRAIVDLGTLWRGSGFNGFISPSLKNVIVNASSNEDTPNIISSEYKTTPYVNRPDKSISLIWSTDPAYTYINYIAIKDSTYSDVATFRTAMSGVQLCYELATPLEIQLDAHAINSLYGVNNIWADSGDTTAEYRANTKLYIEKLTQPEEDDMIADSNIVSGQYFMVGNNLFKATANIANGSAIIVGTNAVRKTLSEALNEINA